MNAPTGRIVLCDDVPELRTLLRYGLEEEGDLEVVGEAGDATAAIALIAELRPDAVLLDLSLPGMDGLEAIPLIRDASPATIIIVFSGFAADRLSRLAVELGAARYLEKGTDIAVVRAVIRDLLGLRRDPASPAS